MVRHAFIPSAGFGTRMGELVQNIPKPMLPVAGRPMIDYTLFHLYLMGIDHCTMNLHYKGQAIEKHLSGFPHFPIYFSYEKEEILLLAGGIKYALSKFSHPPEELLIINPDTLFLPDHDQPLNSSVFPEDYDTILFLKEKDEQSKQTGFSVVEDLSSCSLKPQPGISHAFVENYNSCLIDFSKEQGSYYYVGKSIIRTGILDSQIPGEPGDIIPFWKNAALKRKLYGIYFHGVVLDLGTRENYIKNKDRFPLPEGLHSSWNRFISNWGSF